MEGKETHLLHSEDERGVMEKAEMRTKTQGNKRKKSKGFGVRGVRNSSPSKHHISSCDLPSQKQIKHYSWQDVSFVGRLDFGDAALVSDTLVANVLHPLNGNGSQQGTRAAADPAITPKSWSASKRPRSDR